MKYRILIAALSFLAMFVACDSEHNDEPVMDNQEDNTEQVKDDTEMPDDGMKWVANAPSKSEFDRLVLGKTWDQKVVTYFDSRGHELDFHYMEGGGAFEPAGVMLSDKESLIADSGINSGGRMFRCQYTKTWIYDEKTGRLSLFSNEIIKPVSWYSRNYCLVESVSEDELVLIGQFGILRNNLYEVVENGMDWSYFGDNQDEDSYGRAVYKPVPAGDVAAFWGDFPIRE